MWATRRQSSHGSGGSRGEGRSRTHSMVHPAGTPISHRPPTSARAMRSHPREKTERSIRSSATVFQGARALSAYLHRFVATSDEVGGVVPHVPRPHRQVAASADRSEVLSRGGSAVPVSHHVPEVHVLEAQQSEAADAPTVQRPSAVLPPHRDSSPQRHRRARSTATLSARSSSSTTTTTSTLTRRLLTPLRTGSSGQGPPRARHRRLRHTTLELGSVSVQGGSSVLSVGRCAACAVESSPPA